METLIPGIAFLIDENDRPLSPSLQSLKARRLLARLLYEYYGLIELPRMDFSPDGKPYFPDRPDIHFNLSHCRGAVMAVIAGREVGCDIEDIPDVFPEELLDVAFSLDERRHIAASCEPSRELTCIWTRKEAIVKCLGTIPDDPVDWPSDAPGTFTVDCAGTARYIYSISQ